MAVTLTFDDGPHPEWTPHFLDILDRVGVKATFFVIEGCVRRWPYLVENAVSRGHQIGAHCTRHRSHLKMTSAQIDRDITCLLARLEQIGVGRPSLWRPPYGETRHPETYEIARRHRLHIVTWTVDTFDWAGRRADEIMADITAAERDAGVLGEDSVVLMHDGFGSHKAELVEPLVAEVKRRGWSFGELTPAIGTPQIPVRNRSQDWEERPLRIRMHRRAGGKLMRIARTGHRRVR